MNALAFFFHCFVTKIFSLECVGNLEPYYVRKLIWSELYACANALPQFVWNFFIWSLIKMERNQLHIFMSFHRNRINFDADKCSKWHTNLISQFIMYRLEWYFHFKEFRWFSITISSNCFFFFIVFNVSDSNDTMKIKTNAQSKF